MILLNLIWPAIYVPEFFVQFWFIVIGTIIIEFFVIRSFLKFSWRKSLYITLIGNFVSMFIGTIIMTIIMFFWTIILESFASIKTFGVVNWISTFLLMCLGSVFLETLAIRLIYKEKIKKLFLPMLIGNFLSYTFIAIIMLATPDKIAYLSIGKNLIYFSNKQEVVSLDKSKLEIDTSTIRL